MNKSWSHRKIWGSFTKGRISRRCPCQRPAGTVPVLGPFGRPPKPPQGVFNRTTAVLMLFLIYFTYRCLLITGSKQKHQVTLPARPLFSQQLPNMIVNFQNLIVDLENCSVNLIEVPSRKKIHPFPWSKAPPGQPPSLYTASKGTQDALHT